MMPFSEAQVEALRGLHRLLPGRSLTLIGAGALACHLGLWWRTTRDLDLVLVIDSEAFPGPLLEEPGWRRSPVLEHAWTSPGGALLDLLPVSARDLEASVMVWPESGRTMTLVGFRHLPHGARTLPVTEGVDVTVAGLHVIALLKMVSFFDQPYERRRDLMDLAHLFSDSLAADDPRRFADDVLSAGVTFETASAFVLGRPLREIANDKERDIVRLFLRHARLDGDSLGVRWALLQAGPPSWREDDAALDRILDALAKGIGLEA